MRMSMRMRMREEDAGEYNKKTDQLLWKKKRRSSRRRRGVNTSTCNIILDIGVSCEGNRNIGNEERKKREKEKRDNWKEKEEERERTSRARQG